MRRRDKERRSRIGGELVLTMRVPEIPAVVLHDKVWCIISTCSSNFNTTNFGALLQRVPVTSTRQSLVHYCNVFQ